MLRQGSKERKLSVISCLPEDKAPNGVRYPLVGGTRQRCFDGTNFEPRKLPENAQTPISRVHALLGGFVQVATLFSLASVSHQTSR